VWLALIPISIGLIYLILVGIGAALIVADPIKAVDAVVVLSGDDGDRLAVAVEMHKKGLAPNLVITYTDRQSNQRLKNEAIQAGFPAGNIYITQKRVDSTVDEAHAVFQLAQDKGWDELMVVTDPFHSFRARFIFRREMAGSGIEIFFRPVPGHWFRSPSWFFHPQGWVFVFLEITKFFGYLIGF
jgi:uncharacterized SAM-binding protein YcdF (DUF218 family)